MTENINLVLSDDPYNRLCDSNRKTSIYSNLTDKKWRFLMGFVKNLLARGGHSVIFCSNYQFRRWYQLFSVVIDDITKVIWTPVFNIESKSLKDIVTIGYHDFSPGTFILNKINMVYQAVHLWHNGKAIIEPLVLVDYRRPGFTLLVS